MDVCRPNDQDKLPGRLQGWYLSKSRHAGPVNVIALFRDNV
jgi:hypothetical protein